MADERVRLTNFPNQNNQYTIKDCRRLIPNQSKWSHEEKIKKMREAAKHSKTAKDYENFFKKTVDPFNSLAKELKLANVTFLLAQSALESGWLNIENDWLNNPFGLTFGGKDNMGFESVEQAIKYWKCLFGDKIKGSKTMDEYMHNLKGYNVVNKDYYDVKPWTAMINTVERKAKENGYEKNDDSGTLVFRH